MAGECSEGAEIPRPLPRTALLVRWRGGRGKGGLPQSPKLARQLLRECPVSGWIARENRQPTKADPEVIALREMPCQTQRPATKPERFPSTRRT